MPFALSAPKEVAITSDLDLLRSYTERRITDIISVPCSITDTWHELAAQAAMRGDVNLVLTTHEANLAGIAAGIYFGTGRAALVHMQNSGLPNAADGFISFANSAMYRVPMAVMVTYRGATDADDSEPHQEIGARTDVLCESIFGPDATICGRRDGIELLKAVSRSIGAACAGSIGVVKVASSGFSKSEVPVSSEMSACDNGADRTNAVPQRRFRASQLISREEAILGIIQAHPGAAFVFCNGYTSRCARAIADSEANFYNIGYMGGSLAIGWGLATSRPDREIVVIDGDQNALMSCMKDHMAVQSPRNLHWYVLNNGIGASVGTAKSIPLGAPIKQSATVIRTIPDEPGSFAYPRVGVAGARFDRDIGNPSSLQAFSRRFRRYFEQ